jgi:hypothetical protein
MLQSVVTDSERIYLRRLSCFWPPQRTSARRRCPVAIDKGETVLGGMGTDGGVKRRAGHRRIINRHHTQDAVVRFGAPGSGSGKLLSAARQCRTATGPNT